MPKRKKGKKKSTGRRRIGGIGIGSQMKEAVMAIGGVVLGVAAGRFINTKMAGKVSGTLIGGGEALVGAIGIAKVKNPLVRGIMVGVAANGVLYATGANGLKLLPAAIGYGPSGYDRPPRAALQGYRDVPKIGNFPKPGNIGSMDRDRVRMARMYAGVYC